MQARHQLRAQRRRAVVMTFPPRPHMPHELALLAFAGLAPQPADMRAHSVQRRLPIDALRRRAAALPTHLAQQLPRAAQAVVGGEKIVPDRWLSTHMGQQTMAREHLDRPAVPGLFQGHHGVHHGQPGTDDQHRGPGVELGHGLHVPRVYRGGVQAAGFGLRRARRREHPGGQYRLGATQLLAVIQGQQRRGVLHLQVDHFGAEMLDGGRRQRLGLGQALLRVQAENPARREQLADRHVLLVRLRPAAGADVIGEPLDQVVGVIRVDTHARRIAVQGMAQFDRTVGLAAAEFGARFDH